MQKVLNVIDKILGFIEDWSLFLATMTALIALFANVVLRYGFHYSLAWSEELVREVVILTTFIGCSAAIKARSMIKIDALVQLVPSLKTPLTFFGHAATLFFSILMVTYGSKLVALQSQTSQKTIIMEIPLEWLYSLLPIMGAMMFLRTIQVIYLDIRAMRATK
ncbi:MAG: TRAP transporter small permease [Deltaproteobacteria bacterium CG_4_8_14_3_um_filter_51_11]|nr:TRAP transporter small permease [bacterium]PIP45333.1 MAG: C4-dicarboxylate ABC transporter substrate-binding protein [Deltaproteobacteria bacterium CG23_combo_of_CG06-09_8_20_14_all_51_20]PIW01249.1 MAG: TRAP transporter small permease [Deltaproteobacteria bacterium CG17_big_fil_post_rev_8_21_14_2_50_51_6]PIX20632.1 MAG: TRAP transporter small permease [Deltaproteobacteria bacterium CG_4_8_14_3_um_filter_51_11]PIY27147.1 MAG: TRAP transporter small permease [Deltaproteobacteria bacterium CG